MTLTTVYDVNAEPWSCPCERFKKFKICAHVLAVAAVMGRLNSFLNYWEEPTCDGARNQGRNRGVSQKRSAPSKRLTFDRTQFKVTVILPTVEEKEITFVWLRDNPQVRVCYGCRGNLRPEAKGLPDAPWDLVIRSRMHRVYPKEGEFRISVKKQNTFFHLTNICCSREGQQVVDNNYSIEKPFLLCHIRVNWCKSSIYKCEILIVFLSYASSFVNNKMFHQPCQFDDKEEKVY